MRPALLLLLVLANCPAHAQDCTQILPFNALDQKTGNTVTSLRPESLQARMGDLAVRIIGIVPVEHRRVLVLVDKSGSMAPKNNLGSHQKEVLEATENTLMELLKELPQGVSVAYGFFNNKTVFTEGFFRDFKELQPAIADTRQKLLKPDYGGTALFDALHQAILRFETPQPGDVIVLVSDGGENKSKLAEGEFEKEMRRSGLRLALLFVNQHSSDYEEPFVRTIIGLAEDTGGGIGMLDVDDPSWVDKRKVAETRAAIRKFWTAEVLGGYGLQVQVPANLKKAKKWKVQFNAGTDAQLKHVTLKYPVKVEPCPVKTAEVH
jgi:von Willebrand factor type A domain